jgi:hypothetical protein
MGYLLKPEEIKDKCTKQKGQTQAARDKMVYNYKLLTGRYYQGPSDDKGSYPEYVSNKSKTFGKKVKQLLAGMELTLRIPLVKQGKKKRGDISDTEAFGYGVIDMANQRLTSQGELNLGAEMAFNFPIFGGAFEMLWIHLDEDGETIVEAKVYDPLNSYWVHGKKGFLWYANSRVDNIDSVRDEYGDDSITEEGDKGQCTLYTAWDTKYNYVVSGNKILNAELAWKKGQEKEGVTHELDYVPVHLQKVGSFPHIQIEGLDDTIADSFSTIYDDNSQIYELFSQGMSYGLDMMGKAAKRPYVALADPGYKIDKDFDIQGGVMVLDRTRVTSLEPLIKPEMPAILINFISLMAREISSGSWSDIAYGMFDSAAPVGTTNMMLRTAMSVLIESQLAMEQGYSWFVTEAINQYKKGKFGSLKLHGSYGSKKTYDVEVSPTDIDDNWALEATMHSNLPQDERENAQVAGLLEKFLSKETIQDRLLLVQDTDAENRKMALERAQMNPVVELTAQIDALIKEDEGYSKEKQVNKNAVILLIAQREEIIRQQTQKLLMSANPQPEGQTGQGGQPGMPGGQPGMQPPDRNAANQNMISAPSPDVAAEIAQGQE